MWNYRDFFQKIIYNIINPLIRLMIKVGITPNIITTTGLIGNGVAAWFFVDAALKLSVGETGAAMCKIGWGGVIIIFAGLFDMMDGRLARLGNMSSTFGALWDSALDRYSELITLFGICLVFVKADWFWLSVTTFLAMVGSVMVSYVRARAEGLGIECKVGFMQRPERVVVTALAAIISGVTGDLIWLSYGMLLIAVLSNITAFMRLYHCYKVLSVKK